MFLLQVTKSLERENKNKFCLLVSNKDMHEISSCYSVPVLRYRPHSENKNF